MRKPVAAGRATIAARLAEHPSPNSMDLLDYRAESLELWLHAIHRELCRKAGCKPVRRIAIAMYDSGTDVVTTFMQSNIGVDAIGHHEAHLSQMGSLSRLAQTRLARIIEQIDPSRQNHLSLLYSSGFRSCMTIPIYRQDRLFGFVFFNATKPDAFSRTVIDRLTPYAKLIALSLIHEIISVRLVRAVARMAQEMSRARDSETAAHLDRMANYTRLIATDGAKLWDLTDEYIEYLFWYAPLHDIGKVAIPVSILLKRGKLTKPEQNEMMLHVTKGVAIIDAMIQEFGLDTVPNIRVARNVIASHHENVDGSGYPAGLVGNQIPIEGRIVAVADAFDALTNDRP